MRCIYCDYNSKLEERRTAHGCPKCGKNVAFEPRDSVCKQKEMTDRKFLSAINRCQSLKHYPDGRIKFTTRHLYYELNRSVPRFSVDGRAGLFFLAWFLSPPPILYWLIEGKTMPLWLLFGLIIICAATWKKLHPHRTTKLDAWLFRTYLSRWQEAHGAVKNMLPPYTENACASWELFASSDVFDYSFDRAVVTDNAEIAAMLVANNFHFENNCAVLSVDGFPGAQAETIMAMLRRNPNLTVVAVHDASKSGAQLSQTLRKPHWFPDPSVKIIDVGLLPRHARKLRAPVVEAAAVPARIWTLDARLAAADNSQQPCATHSAALYLRPKDQVWLDQGHVIELATIRPAQLMQALFNAFALAPHAEAYEDHTWSHDYRDYYAADHFG